MFKSVFKSGIRGVYNVSDNASFNSELWSVFPAKHRQNGKQASVFILDKYKLEAHVSRLCSQSSNTKNPKVIISEYYEQIRLEISNLTKLKHPQILTVLEVLEETKSKFLFATEPVSGNLSTLSLADENELSIQKGLLEICKGLQFLHDFCSTIHLNLQPSSVFVNQQGDWKLAGFKFLQNLNDMSSQDQRNYFIMNNASVIDYANHNLNFIPPELVVDDHSERLSTANDVWSLGMMIYYLYNNGDFLINCFETTNVSDYKKEFRKLEQKFYNHRPEELKYLLKEIPAPLCPIMMRLLARFPNDRMSIAQFIDSDFFNGSLIKLMWFIDEFTTKSTEDKIVFLDGILTSEDILSSLPNTFRNAKLLPLLIESIQFEINLLQSSKTLDLETDLYISKMLQVVFNVGKYLSNLSFSDRICDSIMSNKGSKKSESPLLKLAKTSVKVRLSMVSNLDIISKKLPLKATTDIVKDLSEVSLRPSEKITKEVDTREDQIALQDMFLKKLPLVASGFDFPYMKNTFFPLICQVFKTTTILSTKLETIRTFDMLIEKKAIDRAIVSEQLLPIIENLKSRDKRIVKEVVSFFANLQKSPQIDLDLELSVDKVLSQCFRLVFGCNDCSKQEFESFMDSIQKIQSKLVQEKLETLNMGTSSHSANFDTLLHNSSIKQTPKEASIKTPVLKPSTDSSNAPSRESTGQPLTLRSTASRQQAGNQRSALQPKTNLSFGATSTESNLYAQSVVNGLKNPSDLPGSGSMNSSLSPSLDWTTKSGVGSSEIQTRSQIPMNDTPKLPPGFASDMVLTPNSTGSLKTGNTVAQQQDPNDLLDLL